MARPKSLDELVVEWEERAEAGQAVGLEELCKNCPELLEPLRERVEKLREINSALGTLKLDTSQLEVLGNATAPVSPLAPVSIAGDELPSVPGYTVLRQLGAGAWESFTRPCKPGSSGWWRSRCCRRGRMLMRTVNRFKIEAEALARLHHPNLIQIFEVGEVGGRPFFSMEYVPDGTLEERLEGRPQPPEEAARLIEILASAMHEAHRCGIVHRDLKPGNVLLRRLTGRPASAPPESGLWTSSATEEEPASFCPKISDFGLAKRLGEEHKLTLTQSVLGTPYYMAPEQARGDSRNVTETTDVYSLGAIFYELLTGACRSRAEACSSRFSS